MVGHRAGAWTVAAVAAVVVLAACAAGGATSGGATGAAGVETAEGDATPTTIVLATTAPFVEGTLPPTVAPAVTTAPFGAAPTRATATTLATTAALVPVAARTRNTGGEPTRYEDWPAIGTFPGADDITVVAARPPNYGTCIGVRLAADPTQRLDACMGLAATDDHAVVELDDRLVVLTLRTSTDDLRVVTDRGTVTAPLLPTGLTAPDGRELRGTAVVVPAGTDVVGVDDAAFAACPYRALLASGLTADAFTIGRCAPPAAAGVRGASSEIAQPDSAYFLQVDGAWRLVGSGGDPCLSVAPGTVDPTPRTPEERARLEAELALLRQACTALGESTS